MKRLVIQSRAMRDLDAAQAHYRREAPHILPAWALAVDAELRHLQRQPGTGSPRYGLQMGIKNLRGWRVKRFPYLIFYAEKGDALVVARVLHQSLDIPKHLT